MGFGMEGWWERVRWEGGGKTAAQGRRGLGVTNAEAWFQVAGRRWKADGDGVAALLRGRGSDDVICTAVVLKSAARRAAKA